MFTRVSSGPDLTTDVPPRPRRSFPLSLKFYLGILAILGIFAGCVGHWAWQRHLAFVEIDRVKGSVRVAPGGPAWLVRHLGRRHARILGTVEFIGLVKKATDDDTLRKIAPLSETRELVIGATKITDTGLVFVGRMDGLENLILSNTRITDAGFAHLSCLPNLKIIRLDDTLITDAGFAHLGKIKSLRSLHLHRLPIGDAEVRHLKNLPNLESIWLGQTRITDAGLERLSEIKTLQRVELCGTRVTDVGLQSLDGLSNLKYVGIARTQVTEEGIARLKATLPEITIRPSDRQVARTKR